VTGDELAALLAAGAVQLVDVRSADEYDGTAGYGCDPVQGHIPGAVNVEWSDLLAAGAGIPELLAQHGVESGSRIVCYCHSGSRSARAVQALAAAGVAAENYEGSWHEWSRRGAAEPDSAP
jgi:thiosulfate/3-mercaptopyruvate sulfurtransferase